MKTYEMIALAESDSKSYLSGEMFYNKFTGFIDKYGDCWTVNAFAKDTIGTQNGLYEFIMLDGWEVYDIKRMTKSEIEKVLGYKIEIVK